MNRQFTSLKNSFLLILFLCFVAVIAGLLNGCSSRSQKLGAMNSTATSQSAMLSGTSTPILQPTNTPNDKQAFDTRVAQRRAAVATEAALTPQLVTQPTPANPFSVALADLFGFASARAVSIAMMS